MSILGGTSKWKKAWRNLENQLNNAAYNLNNSQNSALIGTDNSDLLNSYTDYLQNRIEELGKGFRHQSTNDLINDFVNKQTSINKNTLQNWFNNAYSGYGTTNSYLDNYWNTNADDAFNTQFLDNYYNQALSQIDTAKERGLLNDAGYNSALSSLDRQKSAATGQINTMTDDVINSYRDDIANSLAGIQTAIDDYSLGQRNNYNSDAFSNQINNLYSQQKNNLETDLNNAVSGYTPFDVSSILADARNTQGILTGGSQNNELVASLDGQKKDQSNKVGLGNQGIF